MQASRFHRGTAYVSFDGHRHGHMQPHIYRTMDMGATWQSLAPNGLESFVHVIAEDPERADLLFAGTERGLFVTIDGGSRWVRFEGNLPPAPVRDLAIQERVHDPVVATHGRGVYIIDDLTPIRALTPETLAAPVALLPTRPAEMPIDSVSWPFTGDDEFVGENPKEEAVITYWLKKRHLFGDLKVEILDAQGTVITTLPGGKRVGINRVAWPMRLKPPTVPPATGLIPAVQGPRVPEGTYTVRLIKGKQVLEGTVTLVVDPRSPHPPEHRAVQQRTALALYHDLERLAYLVDAITDTRDQLEEKAAKVRNKRLRRKLAAVRTQLEALHKDLVATKKGAITGEERLRERLGELYGSVNRHDGRPTASQLERMEILEGQLHEAERRFEALAAGEIAALGRALERTHVEPVTVLSRESWEDRRPGRGGPSSDEPIQPWEVPFLSL